MTAHFGGGHPASGERELLRDRIAELRATADFLELGLVDHGRPDGKRWSVTAFDLLERARVRSRDKLVRDRGGRRGAGGPPDPTGSEAAERVEDNDEDLVRWRELLMDLDVAVTYLRRLPKVLADATPAQQHPDRLEVGCRVCSRPGKPEPIYRSERCQWCYRFWLDWKVDVPPAILKKRREGRTVTEQMIRAELEEAMSA